VDRRSRPEQSAATKAPKSAQIGASQP
jgi:hypothetical protein